MDRVTEEILLMTAEQIETTEMDMDQTGTPVEKEEEQELIEHIAMAMGNEGSARRL